MDPYDPIIEIFDKDWRWIWSNWLCQQNLRLCSQIKTFDGLRKWSIATVPEPQKAINFEFDGS